MKQEFINYLHEIDIKDDKIIERINFIYNKCQKLILEEIEDLFIEDYFNNEGIRIYDDINFFSKNTTISAKNFQFEENYLNLKYKDKMLGTELKIRDFDFTITSSSSRMNLISHTEGKCFLTLKAASNNCKKLFEIYEKYLKI